MSGRPIIGIDPGTEKCGVALLDAHGECQWRTVESTVDLPDRVAKLWNEYPRAVIVVGDGTGSRTFIKQMAAQGLLERFGEPVLVDERYSTEEARRVYLREHRHGWRKLLPFGLQTPDVPVDGYVAEILARRYLKTLQAQGGPRDDDGE